MKTIKKIIRVKKEVTVLTMDDGIRCAPKCKHFISSRHCALKAALHGEKLEMLESDGRGLCLRTEFCVDTFGKGKTK